MIFAACTQPQTWQTLGVMAGMLIGVALMIGGAVWLYVAASRKPCDDPVFGTSIHEAMERLERGD